MGFGWGALAGYRGMGWEIPGSIAVGAAAGLGMVYLLGVMMKGMADLQTSGNISIKSAEGLEGDVYVTVPSGSGRGQVRVNIDNRQRIYNAVSSGEELASGTRVRVVRVNQDNTLTVARA
jgi:membrane protein implicated in regulation of membrane protease activity